ncbi:MAG: hypothetical protein WBD55_03770 [Dehalococcoidia bacterium]
MRAVLKLGGLAAFSGFAALLHHGHIQQFILLVNHLLTGLLPKRLPKPERHVEPSLLQVSFGEPSTHYEVWVQRKARAIEIGLHFEGMREDNRRCAEALAERALELQAQLGPDAEIEEWTRSWTRLHESWPIEGPDWSPKRDLTPELAQRVAERLARYIEVLEPVVKAIAPPAAGQGTTSKKKR